MTTTTLSGVGATAYRRFSFLTRPLAALGLLLTTASLGQAQTTTFTLAASPATYTVPVGVTTLQVVATGGSGGGTADSQGNSVGGFGARVQATVTVTPGEVLTVVVGGQGTTDNNFTNAGGANGGGTGSYAGGGGGATVLRRAIATGRTSDYLSSRNALVVAGGGGGGYYGGAGGSPVGGNGGGRGAGSGATVTSPGGGVGPYGNNPGSDDMGGAGIINSLGSGGGGGGGYYGGGGGAGGGGGGGSSMAAATSTTFALAPMAGDGLLTITPVYATPTLISLSPTSGGVGTSVTLTGTNLSGATAVSFNGTATTTFTVVNATTLTATVPTGATSGNVTVTTPGGTSNGVAFTVVAPVTLTTPSPLPSGTVGAAYSQSFTAAGGTAPYTYALVAGAGTLPMGLTLASTGSLTGTPTQSGTFSFTVRATDASTGSGPYSGERAYSLTIAPAASGLSVQYQTGDLGQPTDGQIRPFLQLVNTGSMAVPYSSLTVRYWLTVENFMGQLVTPIDYAKLGTGFVSARYVQLATPRQGALGYIEYSFAAGAGNLAAGTNSGPIYGKAYKPDYSSLDETDDWSYLASGSFTPNDHVTLYQNGTLIAGTEPPAVTTATALNVYSASRDASASTQYISVQLQVRNTGNVPVNYSDVKLRYYFTRDGASTLVPQVDYAKLGNGNISVRYVPLASVVSGADGYLEIGFSAALGVFYPRTSTDDILLKIRQGNYAAFDQTNDYSFTNSTALLVNNRFPAYLNGSLVFGTPPAGAPARPATSLASTPAVGGPLAVSLTGSPNPTSDQLQLEFSLAYTQTYSLALYDGQGRLVRELPGGKALAGQAQQVTLPVQELAAGLYLVRLTTATDRQQLKFLKQ